MGEAMEQRNTDRIIMEVPIKVGAGHGTTRNISGDGIYFVLNEEPKLGGEIRFSIELEYVLPHRPLRLSCVGQVLRVEDLGSEKGVAAKINKYCYKH